MQNWLWVYRLQEVTDPSYAPYRLRAGGDVAKASQGDGEHFLRALGEFAPGAACAAVRFVYRPEGEGGDPQQRLAAFLVAKAHDDRVVPGLEALVERGPLRRFLRLGRVDSECLSSEPFGAACDIVRHVSLLEPTVTTEFNAKALPAYGALRSFEPREDNDYLLLDTVLSGLSESVLVDICVGPADIRREISDHTRYLASLLQVNRGWDGDGGEADIVQWRRPNERFAARSRIGLEPLRVKEPLADDILRRQQRFHETLLKPHLRFRIRVHAQTQAIARLVASVVAESAFEEGSYELVDRPEGDAFAERAARELQEVVIAAEPDGGQGDGGTAVGPCSALFPLSHLAPVDELTGVFRMPTASHSSPRCIRRTTDPPTENVDDLICLGHDDDASQDVDGQACPRRPRGIQVGRLPKHAFISGVPGSGKTIAAFNFLLGLAEKMISFLVFEPGKSEYRVLKCLKEQSHPGARRLAREMAVYTPGSELASPFRMNPLCIPEGVGRDEHIENLLSCFKAAMPMSGPLPALLGEALEEVYEEYPDRERPPRLVDLHRAARSVLASKGYSGEVDSDIRAALEVRLGLLTRRAIGRVFQCNRDVPAIGDLVSGFNLIELGALPNETACLLTLFVLMAIREHLKTLPYPDHGPRLVILLEEAHNLVGRSGEAQASEENADPKAFAAEFICRMLAELRALGVGIVILDQLPSAVAPEVVKQTGSKLCFRQVSQDEREAIGNTMLFGPIEMEETARLQPGEAYFYTEGYLGPQRIRTPNLHAELGLPVPPVGESILPYIRDDAWFREALVNRVTAESEQLMVELDRFDRLRLGVGKRTAALVAARPRTLKTALPRVRRARLARLARRARGLREELASALRLFARDRYRPLLGESAVESGDDALDAFRRSLVTRFENVILPGTQSTIEMLERLASSCAKPGKTMVEKGA